MSGGTIREKGPPPAPWHGAAQRGAAQHGAARLCTSRRSKPRCSASLEAISARRKRAADAVRNTSLALLSAARLSGRGSARRRRRRDADAHGPTEGGMTGLRLMTRL